MQPSSALSSSGQMLTERQRFDTDKNILAEDIHTGVDKWFCLFSKKVPNQNVDLPEGTILFEKENLLTGGLEYFLIDENKLLSKVPANLDLSITKISQSKTGFASYNFFLNRLVTDYTGKFESIGEVIKETEHIEDLRNSKVFKTVCLSVIQFQIAQVQANQYMLRGDKSDWWV